MDASKSTVHVVELIAVMIVVVVVVVVAHGASNAFLHLQQRYLHFVRLMSHYTLIIQSLILSSFFPPISSRAPSQPGLQGMIDEMRMML
jgi:hypothetical protein